MLCLCLGVGTWSSVGPNDKWCITWSSWCGFEEPVEEPVLLGDVHIATVTVKLIGRGPSSNALGELHFRWTR